MKIHLQYQKRTEWKDQIRSGEERRWEERSPDEEKAELVGKGALSVNVRDYFLK